MKQNGRVELTFVHGGSFLSSPPSRQFLNSVISRAAELRVLFGPPRLMRAPPTYVYCTIVKESTNSLQYIDMIGLFTASYQALSHCNQNCYTWCNLPLGGSKNGDEVGGGFLRYTTGGAPVCPSTRGCTAGAGAPDCGERGDVICSGSVLPTCAVQRPRVT